MPRIASTIKTLLLPRGKRVRRIPFGLFRGLRFQIDLSSQFQAYLGLNEAELAPWFERFSRTARTALDVGAAQGYYTLYWLGKTQVEKVLAFEPEDAMVKEIEANLIANADKVECTRLDLHREFIGDNAVKSAANVGTTRLDRFVNKIQFPCVVKMDIEGAELEALRTGEKLLSRDDVSWIVETHSWELDVQCRKLFSKYGYHTLRIEPAWWRVLIPELRPALFNSWIVAYRKA